jgi:2-iminobutanoate/2-iminopropanoate deaminase
MLSRNFRLNDMKKIINTNEAPAPIGPYNQAVQAAGMLFVSGQIAINPENGQLLAGDITIETYQVMANLKAILKEAGLDFSDVVKTSIFLSDMAHFAQIDSKNIVTQVLVIEQDVIVQVPVIFDPIYP